MQRSLRGWLRAGGVLAGLAVAGFVSAQTAPAGSQAAADTRTNPPMTVTGCVARAGDGFSLQVAAPAAGTASSGLTSSTAGTSATGAAPSGTVTGQTPTGSTATETATPTPAAGTPGATAAPASPTYNRPTAGTTGTVSRPDTPAVTPAPAAYKLDAAAGIDLAGAVGHTVEVTGRLIATPDQKCCDTEGERQERQSSTRDADRQQQQRATRAAGPDASANPPKPLPSLHVDQLRSVATSCRP
jgi:hypothetical protein